MTAHPPRLTALHYRLADRPDAPGALPPVACPEALWQSVRAQVLDQPSSWEELAGDGRWLADCLWPQWAAPLEACGADAGFLAEIVAGHRRELWLWLMGERTWAHTLTSLAGRTLRRAPALTRRGDHGRALRGPKRGPKPVS